MAQGVVIRFKADSTEYDAKLKRSIEQMKSMEDQAKKLQGSIDRTDEGYVKFVQSLGKMDTVAKSSKTALREYSEAILYLQQQYKALSDAEKSGEVGKAMAASIDQLKQRAAEAQDTIGDLSAEIKHMASDTPVFDKLAGGVGLVTDSFAVLQGTAQALGIRNKDILDSMAKLQGAMAVSNALVRIQNALQKQSAVMIGITTVQKKAETLAIKLNTAAQGKNIAATTAATAAQKVLNAVAKANPYVLLAMAVAGVTAALFGLARSSNSAADAEEKAKDAAEDRKEAYKNVGNTVGTVVAQYKLLQTEWQNLSSETEKETWIKKNSDAFKQLGLNISDVVTADRAFVTESQNVLDALQKRAMATAMSDLYQQEVKKAYEEVFENLSTKAYLTEEEPKSVHSKNIEAYGLIEGEDYSLSRSGNSAILTESGAQKVREARISTYLEKQLAKRIDKIQKLYGVQLVKALDEAEEAVGATDLVSDLPQGTDTQKTLSLLDQRNERIQAINKSIEELNGVLASTADEETKAWATQQLKQYQSELDRLNGKLKQTELLTGPSGYSQEGISALRSQIQGGQKSMQMGSQEYMVEANRLVDLTTFENLLKTAVQRGVELDPALLESAFEKIDLGVDVPAEEWQNLVDIINEQVNELNPDPIELDVKTGAVKEVKNEMSSLSENVNGAISAFGQLGSAIQQIEDPSAKVAGIIMSAVAEVAAGLAQMLASPQSTAQSWGWIALAISGTSTMLSTIAAIKSATSGGFANGGIVPGNSFSGDNLRTSDYGINAGELILNRAQQGAIAGQLNSNPMGNMRLSTEISGSNLRVVLNNDNRQRGGSRDVYGVH